MSEGMKVIATALHAVMEDTRYVQKTKKNTFHNYTYAGEGDLLEALRPSMVKHGLMLVPSVQEASEIDQYGNIVVRIDYTLMHKDGHIWPEKITAFGCGNDKNKNGIGDKGLYKALTGANKYLLFKLFQIETGDDPERDEPAAPARVPSPDRDVANTCLEQIAKFDDVALLKQWWEKTSAMLPNYDIVNETGHPGAATYVSIFNAVKQRVLAIKHPPIEAPKEEPKQLAAPDRPKFDDDIPF